MSDRIEEIRARHRAVTWRFYELKSQIHDDREMLLAEVDRLTRERDEARAALKPFAAEAKAYDPPEGDDEHPAWVSRFTLGNLRDARKALEAKP